jgi:hypothetical protein
VADVELSALETAVFHQFGKMVIPTDMHLLYDERCLHDECVYIKSAFSNKNWWEVNPPNEKSFPSDLFSFFSEEAINYYFPTFMLEIARSYQAADVLVDRFLELIHDGIIGEDNGENSPVHNPKLILTFGQLLVVIKFLKFIGCRYQDEMAMDLLVLLEGVVKEE